MVQETVHGVKVTAYGWWTTWTQGEDSQDRFTQFLLLSALLSPVLAHQMAAMVTWSVGERFNKIYSSMKLFQSRFAMVIDTVVIIPFGQVALKLFCDHRQIIFYGYSSMKHLNFLTNIN